MVGDSCKTSTKGPFPDRKTACSSPDNLCRSFTKFKPAKVLPALLTNMSILPDSSHMVCIAFYTEFSSVTSSCIKRNGSFSSSAMDFKSEPFCMFLIVAYVVKLFLARIKDISRPIPLELPVTIATF